MPESAARRSAASRKHLQQQATRQSDGTRQPSTCAGLRTLLCRLSGCSLTLSDLGLLLQSARAAPSGTSTPAQAAAAAAQAAGRQAGSMANFLGQPFMGPTKVPHANPDFFKVYFAGAHVSRERLMGSELELRQSSWFSRNQRSLPRAPAARRRLDPLPRAHAPGSPPAGAAPGSPCPCQPELGWRPYSMAPGAPAFLPAQQQPDAASLPAHVLVLLQ